MNFSKDSKPADRWTWRIFAALIALLILVGLASALAACRDRAIDHPLPPTAPATEGAQKLRDQERDNRLAAAEARSKGDEAEARIKDGIADTAGKLATEWEARGRSEQVEIDKRVEADRTATQKRLDDQRKADDAARLRFYAAIAVGLSVLAGGALAYFGLPRAWAIGVPALMAAACLVTVLFPAIADALSLYVRWGLIAIGSAVALVALFLLAVLGRFLFREWRTMGQRLGEVDPLAKVQADAASLDRQPRFLRWLVDLLHDGHAHVPVPPPSPAVPAP